MSFTRKMKNVRIVSSNTGPGDKRAVSSAVQTAFGTVFFVAYFHSKEVQSMVTQLKLGGQKIKTAYWSLVGTATAMMLSVQPMLAANDTIWTRFSTIMKDIYGQLVGISTIVAVTMAAVALLVRMISRNQRAVDEATSWLKRIVVTWVILNTLGFIVAYLQPLVQGGNYSP